MFIVVVFGMGVASNVEGFAKGVFNQSALDKFNKLNTAWLVVYFFLLRILQTYGLIGVMIACVIFYTMRIIIAIYLASSMNSNIRWQRLVKAFIPSMYESMLFIVSLLLTRQVMITFKDRPIVGFIVCIAIGAVHFTVFVYYRRPMIKEFRSLLKST